MRRTVRRSSAFRRRVALGVAERVQLCADGRAIADKDLTCGNWTKSGEGSAMVGHHDRVGLRDDDASKSWNSSHPSRGCSQDALRSSGGDGLFYCFAAK
jgi:hypothetical protein